MSTEFKHVEIYSNWCYIDRLDGKELQDGEALDVLWPNGETTSQTIKIKKTYQKCMDMGHMVDIPIHEAYLQMTVNGAPTSVFINKESGIKVRRTNPAAASPYAAGNDGGGQG